ncbi:hypothetical protein HAHE_42580 [Haloferula helveola]|uniref:Uncharacterized protein n=1 Tax=Haloferula helveola TaxID=490095 RepID=A0ABN6H9J9_9BACT|nr:hypothetical protein HAHE_42580 [Haloferula helveola]
MLAGSLRLRASEPAPAVPSGLLDDLNQRFSTRKIVIEAPRQFTLFRRLRSMLETPAFGMAAAIILVLAIAGPTLRQMGGGDSHSFRGTPGSVEAPVRIVLIDGPAELPNFLKSSTDIEPGSLISVGDYGAAMSLEGPKVILDFKHSIIRSHSENGEVVYSDTIPESLAMLADAISEAVLHL